MTSFRKFTARLAPIGLLVLLPLLPALGQDKKKPLPTLKDVTWKLQVLDQEPLKVISTEYDREGRAVYWVIELTRDLNVYENGAYWGPAYKESKRPLFRFEFHDAAGIVLRTVDGQYVGEYVTKAGKRFGALLIAPPEVLLTKTVEAVPK